MNFERAYWRIFIISATRKKHEDKCKVTRQVIQPLREFNKRVTVTQDCPNNFFF